jgi:hypothetical protein
MYGKGNSGPAREVWKVGDRVSFRGISGTVASPRCDPEAHETHHVWVEWDDDLDCYMDPSNLDVSRQ